MAIVIYYLSAIAIAISQPGTKYNVSVYVIVHILYRLGLLDIFFCLLVGAKINRLNDFRVSSYYHDQNCAASRVVV